ncbi:MAG: toll/interleukin-1 receptor domain-containing protein [Candidatus Didemnitutus sp.]|nr:toll/interleukin-1 receptor domain-containing protein [Candidatus Didemnitutus sp.]
MPSPPLARAAIVGSGSMLGETAGGGRRYRVFLSYSHADARWARWLMGRLENYRVPGRLHGRAAPVGQVGARLAPVFRDRDELPSASNLSETIEAALRVSETLVVICSPRAALSPWVQAEIVAFKRLHGERRVFGFIVEGEPKIAGAADDCFPPALRAEVDPTGDLSGRPAEIVAADARPQGDGQELALLRLIAGLLGVGFDELRQRELMRRRIRWAVSAGAAVVVVGLVAMAWHSRNAEVAARFDAQRRQAAGEELMTFLLDDVKTKLEKAEKLAAVEKAGARIMAYFRSLEESDLTAKTLAQHARGLTQIAQIRIEQMRNDEAWEALDAALGRLETLIRRHPQDPEALFERAQAEYWTGFVLRRLSQNGEQAVWLKRYRDTAAALVALEPTEPRWQQELAYGYHNLAVIAVDAGNPDEARAGFLAELAIVERLSDAEPADLQLRNQVADAHSWLGTVAEQRGDLGEARDRFAEYVTRIEAIQQLEPDSAKWKVRLGDALSLHASVMAITGEKTRAREKRDRALGLFTRLVAADPQNRTFGRRLLALRLREVELSWSGGNAFVAESLVDELQGKLEHLLAREPQDRGLLDRLGVACRIQAEVQSELGRPGARATAERAVELGERTMGEQHVSDQFVSSCAQARITAGRLAALAGDAAAAKQHWRRALELLEPRTAGSAHWRILFPAAHVHALLGQTAESRALVNRLQRIGFMPLEPWPDLRTP